MLVSLGIATAFFTSNDGDIVTFSRDVIDSQTIPSFMGLTTLREMEIVNDVTKQTLSSANGWSAGFLSKWPSLPPRPLSHESEISPAIFRLSAPGHPQSVYHRSVPCFTPRRS